MRLDVFETLADPTRRRILDALRGGEHAVNDIVGRVGIAQSGVSRHLRILSDARFVKMRPAGQQRLYSLEPEPFREVEAWLDRYREVWEARLDRFGSAIDKRRKRT